MEYDALQTELHNVRSKRKNNEHKILASCHSKKRPIFCITTELHRQCPVHVVQKLTDWDSTSRKKHTIYH